MRLTLGDDDVGVVEQTVDRSRGEAFREDRVETGRVQVRGEDQRAALVGRIDEAIESLSLFGPGGQQADVVDDDELRADDPLNDLAGRGIDPGSGDRRRQRLEGEPADA
jgi:hypothetical protein